MALCTVHYYIRSSQREEQWNIIEDESTSELHLSTWFKKAFGDVDVEVRNELRATVDQVQEERRVVEVRDSVPYNLHALGVGRSADKRVRVNCYSHLHVVSQVVDKW